MSKRLKIGLILGSILLLGVGVFLVLKNTLFYDYEEKITKYLTQYLETKENENIEKLDKVLDKIRNNDEKIKKANIVVKEELIKEYDKFIDAEFASLAEFDKALKDNQLIVEDIYKIEKSNKNGIAVRLLTEGNREDILYLYSGSFNNLDRYYLAKDLVADGDYKSAFAKLDEIHSSEKLEQKADAYKEVLVKQVMADIKSNVEKMESDIVESGQQKQYKLIVNYLAEVPEEYGVFLKENDEYNELVKKYKEKYDSYLNSSDVEYDVSKFVEANVNSVLEMIENNETYIVYIGRKSCSYCVQFVPTLSKSVDAISEDIYYIDASKIDKNSDEYVEFIELAKDYGQSYPTLVVFRNGELVKGSAGVLTYNRLLDFYKSAGIEVK